MKESKKPSINIIELLNNDIITESDGTPFLPFSQEEENE